MDSSSASWVYGGISAAAGLGLVWGGFAYASMWPGSRLFGSAITAPRRPGELALTFDDGPNPAWTPQLLEILAGHNVSATFFMVGKFAEAEPALVRRVAQAGHLIGNHSWNHPNLAVTGDARIYEELKRTSDALEQIIGSPVRFFRPPFGARRPEVFRVARSLGLAPVLWNAMTNDWEEPSPERITESLSRRIDRLTRSGRAVNIVLHDGGHRALGANREPSVNAARQLIEKFKPTHRFVTLENWTERMPEGP
jgi:peptidoglycan-N-acetylglucosamine deacetylase